MPVMAACLGYLSRSACLAFSSRQDDLFVFVANIGSTDCVDILSSCIVGAVPASRGKCMINNLSVVTLDMCGTGCGDECNQN